MIFVEYEIREDCIPNYMSWMQALCENEPDRAVYQSADQGALFVEVWQHPGLTVEEVRYYPLRAQLYPYVKGGEERIKAWAFHRVSPLPE
ncbi:hypothetical protein [Marinicrinis sediminis]|uniref:DUF4286 family protein n=1 Tax=Marinicrinis sediminis TaxID=1652465 RepID=A0ABW5R6M9_9BACL